MAGRFPYLRYFLLAFAVATTVAQESAVQRPATRTAPIPIVEGREIFFKRIQRASGLSQTRVSHIVQDHTGFLWLGTQDGLNRYDGYRCKVFKHDPARANSLSGVYIHSLFVDRDGAVWVGSDQFLDRFDPVTESFTHFRLEPQDTNEIGLNVEHISQDRSGLLWLSTRSGLYGLDPASGKVKRYQHTGGDATTIGDNDVKSTGEDRQGALWVATSTGLDQFDAASGQVIAHIPLGESGMGLVFHEDRAGQFWIIYGPDQALAMLDRKTHTVTRLTPTSAAREDAGRTPFYSLLEDRDGTMWFGTGHLGLLQFDREKRRFLRYTQRFHDPESLPDTRVIALVQDREGNIWTGLHQTEPVFFSRGPAQFQKFSYQPGNPNSLGSALVSVIHEDADGTIWLGADRMLKRFSPGTGQYSTSALVQGTEALAMVDDGPEILWIGTAGQGLKRHNRRTGETIAYVNRPGDDTSLCSNFVERLLLTADGTLWAATWDGLSRLDPKTHRFTSYKPDKHARGLNYYALAADRDGTLWLGSNLGLLRFDPRTGRFTVFSHHGDDPASLSDNRVNTILRSSSGELWVGTQNGLDRFDKTNGTFVHYSERSGAPGRVVSCLMEDAQQRLWMSTNRGVTRFVPGSREYSYYSTADGLPGPDLTGWGACFQSRSGRMFFGGFSGAVAFHPEQIQGSSVVPPTVLTDFRLFGESVAVGPDSLLRKSIPFADSIRLAHYQNIFSIEYAALSYFSAETNRYRYKLEGLQDNWIAADSGQRVASYTTLPYGTYTFRVQGATSHGPWGEPGAVLRIEILPPWWSTPLFRFASGGAALLLGWFAYRYRIHQIDAQYCLRIEERIAERTRIARELHDTLLQGFQGLIYCLQAVRDALPERPADAIRILDESMERGDRALEEARIAVQDLRSTGDPGHDLSQQWKELAEEFGRVLPEAERPVFHLAVEGRQRDVDPIVRDHIYRIMREATGNAYRHANAKRLDASVCYGEDALELRIRDNGRGIESAVMEGQMPAGHWGLAGMRERAAGFGATVEIQSSVGAGTEVTLRVPAEVAYGKPGWKVEGVGR